MSKYALVVCTSAYTDGREGMREWERSWRRHEWSDREEKVSMGKECVSGVRVRGECV